MHLGVGRPLTDAWVRDAVVPYGAAAGNLGVDASDTACPPGCGPDSAALGPSGTWWVLDSVKHRVVELTRDGRILTTIAIPGVVDGVSAQGAHSIRILDDGTVVLDDSGRLLVIRSGELHPVTLQRYARTGVSVVIGDDGSRVFVEAGDRIDAVSLDTEPPTVTEGVLRTRDGSPFRFLPDDDGTSLTVAWLDELGHITARTSVDFRERFAFTWASEHSGLVLLVSSAANNMRTAIVRVGPDAGVTTEPASGLWPRRMPGLAAVSTSALGWTGIAAAEMDGLHLYHRVLPGGQTQVATPNGHSCDAPNAATVESRIGPASRLAGDFDGDGTVDEARAYVMARRAAIAASEVYQVALADGRTLDPQSVDDVFAGALGGAELLASHDFDGDGRAELLLRAEGETLDVAGIAHLDGCRLTALSGPEREPAPFLFTYGIHSNSAPAARVAVSCTGSQLTVTTSRPDMDPQAYAALSDAQTRWVTRRWERDAYSVGADSVTRVSRTQGRSTPASDPVPEGAEGVRC